MEKIYRRRTEVEFQIYEWLEKYTEAVEQTFGYRIWFLGVQGSYARGEATPQSDIDVVLILDKLLPADLRIYRNMLDGLPYREKICGFISGKEELEHWAKEDLFQFCCDTLAMKGSLEELFSTVKREDINRALHTGACDIYHAACHNMLHERNADIVAELYKSAVFLLQAKFYLETGEYIKKKAELFVKLEGLDREVLYRAMQMKKQSGRMEEDSDEMTQKLLEWASDIIRREDPAYIDKRFS